MFPFLDIESKTFVIRNSSSQSFELPYRAIVFCGDYRPDDTGSGEVSIRHTRNIDGPNRNVIQTIFSAERRLANGTTSSIAGCAVGELGDTIFVDADDDMSIVVYYLRLPQRLVS